MCLIIKSGPHVAKKDFFTLKIATNLSKEICYSPYQNFGYEYGKEYLSTIDKSEKETGEINRGIHSLLVENISDGRWVAVYYFWSRHHSPSGLLLCKIPKGTTYYLGEDGDVVSETIKILFPVIDSKLDSDSIEDGINIPHTSFSNMAEMVEEWVKNAGYNIQPS